MRLWLFAIIFFLNKARFLFLHGYFAHCVYRTAFDVAVVKKGLCFRCPFFQDVFIHDVFKFAMIAKICCFFFYFNSRVILPGNCSRRDFEVSIETISLLCFDELTEATNCIASNIVQTYRRTYFAPVFFQNIYSTNRRTYFTRL